MAFLFAGAASGGWNNHIEPCIREDIKTISDVFAVIKGDFEMPPVAPTNPAAMTPAELAQALGMPEATIRRHINQGAPRSANGSLNLVHYAAWLNTPAPGSSEDDLTDG